MNSSGMEKAVFEVLENLKKFVRSKIIANNEIPHPLPELNLIPAAAHVDRNVIEQGRQ